MDHVEGTTLGEWIAETPDATVAQRLRLLAMVAGALDEMHSGAMTEVAVAHGDVKPANIVVRDDGAAILVDLGLACLADDAGVVTGRSAAYAAPELRATGVRPTPACDRYAFAVTTAQLLTAQPPPTGPDGWLDHHALHTLLTTNPLTARRHLLVRRLMDLIDAPAEARTGPLSTWLSNTVDSLSQVTSQPHPTPSTPTPAAASAPERPMTSPSAWPSANPRPPRGHRRRRTVAVLAAVLVVVALAGGWLLRSAEKKPAAATATTAAAPPTIQAAPATEPAAPANTEPNEPATPTPTAYHSDWRNGATGWGLTDDWATVNGQLTSAGQQYNTTVSAVAPAQVQPDRDYTVAADIQFIKLNPAEGSYGVAAALDQNGDSYGIGVTSDNNIVLALNSNGILADTLDSKPFTPDSAWHNLKIEVNGNSITGFLDGQPILHATDNTVRDGTRVGLWSAGTQINVEDFGLLTN